nr:unnamed protein product [Callosobruchus chinensis]
MKYPQAVHIPSSVSDWLEEQLEARGIESVLYARYILSLLRTHTVDVVCPDDDGDLQLEHLKKEVKGSSGRKRCRKTSADWWRLSQADAEQLKRSAAVECLMSASDQNCEMESLVDELCAKLKEANEGGSDSGESSCDVVGSGPGSAPRPIQQQGGGKRVTPRELAERYYAAFPPLGRARAQQQASACWRRAAAVAADRSRCGGGIAFGAHSWENRFYGKVPMDAHKSRPNHPRQRPRLQRTKSTPVRKSSWDHGPSLMKKPKQLFQTNQQNKKSDGAKHQHKCRSKEKTLEIDQRLEEPATKEEWTTNEDDVNMYEDLPVDIRELLDSPEPQDNTVEIMNVMNVRDNGNRSFIPYGTNIMSSIWSTDRATATLDNIFNSALDADDHETALNFQFSSISIDNNNDGGGGDADWSARWRRDDFEDVENEINSFFERESRHAGLFGGDQRWSDDQFQSLPLQRAGGWEGGVVGEERRGVEDEKLSKQVAVSLMKINHSKEKSCFKEIPPKGQKAFKVSTNVGLWFTTMLYSTHTSSPIYRCSASL